MCEGKETRAHSHTPTRAQEHQSLARALAAHRHSTQHSHINIYNRTTERNRFTYSYSRIARENRAVGAGSCRVVVAHELIKMSQTHALLCGSGADVNDRIIRAWCWQCCLFNTSTSHCGMYGIYIYEQYDCEFDMLNVQYTIREKSIISFTQVRRQAFTAEFTRTYYNIEIIYV